jgi:hypothetical protein
MLVLLRLNVSCVFVSFFGIIRCGVLKKKILEFVSRTHLEFQFYCLLLLSKQGLMVDVKLTKMLTMLGKEMRLISLFSLF